jgi:hypothetical protein
MADRMTPFTDEAASMVDPAVVDVVDDSSVDRGYVDPVSDDAEIDDGDRAEQATAAFAMTEDLPAPLPPDALDEALDDGSIGDVLEQRRDVPLDDDDYR